VRHRRPTGRKAARAALRSDQHGLTVPLPHGTVRAQSLEVSGHDHTIIGDRYRRVWELWPAFRVVRLIEFEHHPDHVILAFENADRRSITIGASEL